MKMNVKHLLVTATCSAVLLVSCKRDPVNPPVQNIDAMSEQIIKTEVGRLLNRQSDSRYAMVVEGGNKLNEYYRDEFSAKEMSDKINHFRDVNASISYRYTAVEVNTEVTKVEKNKEEVSVWTTDKYKMVSNDPDPEKPGAFVTTLGEYQHLYKMALLGNAWKIVSEECLNDGGPWYINLEPAIGNMGNTVRPTTEGIQYTYNRANAAYYAFLYWEIPNATYYCDYTAYGGDCTNFVSQCIRNGGWTTNGSWFHNGASCCTNLFGACRTSTCFTCSWIAAPDFYNYVRSSGRAWGASAVRDCNVGDVIQIGNNSSSSSTYHTMIVNRTTGSGSTKMVYLSYRNGGSNKPTYDKPFTQISGNYFFPWLLKSSGS